MMIEESRAYRYAKWCIGRNNRKVGRYVKLQAKRWLKIADGKHKSAYVSEKAYRKICRLLKLMVHPDLSCSMYEGLEDYAGSSSQLCSAPGGGRITAGSTRRHYWRSPAKTSRLSTPP